MVEVRTLKSDEYILSVAVPVSVRQTFDYLPPTELSVSELSQLQPGLRVKVPFGNRQTIGFLLAIKKHSTIDKKRLKAATAILDPTPLLPDSLFQLAQWAAHYYHHPIGDALMHTLPRLLRKDSAVKTISHWRLTHGGQGLPEGALKSAPKQAELLALLQQQASIDAAQLKEKGITRATAKALCDKQLIESFTVADTAMVTGQAHTVATDSAATDNIADNLKEQPFTLNDEQQHAVTRITQQNGYRCFLLHGVTGSGKTEVYLQCIAHCLQKKQQALVLVPEIGLTPQMVARFKQRFNAPLALLHSGLSDRERLSAWQAARTAQAMIVIGTRSAVFTPMPQLGLIIVDEEHDASFKQQDGFRYSARDIAIKRAYEQPCPIVLGSATPSLESLQHALEGSYNRLQLQQRATGASQPSITLLDIRHTPLDEGFSPALLSAITETLTQKKQVLVFLNRRGFSPVLLCHDCGYIACCDHCDVSLTVHFHAHQLRCHHCDKRQALPKHCPVCASSELDFRGVGTERSERALQKHFPQTPVIRIDRDTTRAKTAMQDLIKKVEEHPCCILVGTQMLAKGHHFPRVMLVAVVDADRGLFTADFRGPEKMGQLLLQVAGRAGRESQSGQVIIQTHQADHPLMISLSQDSYTQYADHLLQQRAASQLPPFGYLALVRAEAKKLESAEALLHHFRCHLPATAGLRLLGPLPAPMARRAGYYHAQLILQAQHRKTLHRALGQLSAYAEQHPLAKRLRWSIDVDPIDPF